MSLGDSEGIVKLQPSGKEKIRKSALVLNFVLLQSDYLLFSPILNIYLSGLM